METKRVRDLTKGTPWKIITLFSIPIIISYLLQHGYQLVDSWMIGNMLNENAFASIGTTNPLNLFVRMFAIGTATGFSVITAQRFGKGDMENMKKSYIHGLILCVIIGVIVSLLACLFTKPLLLAVDVNQDNVLFNDAFNYIFIIFLGLIPTIFYNYFASILRAVGNNKMPLTFLILAAILNIGCNYVLLEFTSLGVAGAAIGTIFSQLVSALASFIYIQIRYPEFKIKIKELKLDREDIRIHLKQGLPMGIQFSFMYIALIILQREVNKFDTGAITAFSASNQVDALIMQPFNGIGTAMVTYVGQNYGAKKYKRIKDGIKQISLVQLALVLVLMIPIFLIKDNFIYFLIDNPTKEAIEYAPIFLTFIGCSQIFIATIFIYRNALQAAGYSMQAMIVSIIQCFTRAGFALLLPMFMGIYGVALATPLAWTISAILYVIFSIFLIFKKLPNENLNVEVV